MQNTTLPIQFAPNSTPAPQRQTAAPSPDGAPFAQTLARQVQQRQQEQTQQARPPIKAGPQSAPSSAAPAPTRSQIKPPAESADAGAPSQTQTQTQAGADAPAGTDAPPSTTASSPTKADGQDSADGDSSTVDASTAAAAAAAPADASPMASLIAIVASFNQQAAAPTPAVTETAQAALGSATERLLGNRGDPAAGFGQKFDHAAKAGAKTIAPEAATTGTDKAGATATAEASDALPAAPAADSKTASFAAALQERTEAQPAMLDKAAERVALLSAREPAPAATAATLAAPVQQASLAITQAIAAPGNQLAARVGTPDWDNQLGQKIVFMAAGQDQSATLTLNPPDLGPMQVVLSVSNDQAQVTFSAAAPEVRQALEAAMPKLRDMMSESGITLGQANVNDGAAQRQAQGGDERGQGGRGNGFGKNNGESASVETPLRRGRILGGAGAVDTFA
ncbi:MAG: flagellar hook-length control protein FliK [Massilia sp.]